MSQRTILYGAEALFVGPTPSTGAQAQGNIKQIYRVQSFGYDFTNKLVPVQEFGSLGYISQIPVEVPTVTFNTSYIVSNVYNESGIGLYVGGDKNCVSTIIDGTQGDKNYWLRVVPDGQSAAGYSATDGGVIGFGNGALASYRTEGRVGGLPTASISVECFDINFVATGANFDSPAINPVTAQPITGLSITLPTPSTGQAGQLPALRPGDITVNLRGAGIGLNNICIQSYNLSVDFSLEPIICLGSRFPTSREIKFPTQAKCSFEALTRDIGTGRVSSLYCGGNYNVDVTLRSPTCDGSLGAVKAYYGMTGAVLNDQKFSNGIGNRQTVTLDFSVPIGGATDVNGLYISGSLV